ncbi:hypothetical protein [Streptomyces sp. Ru87]|uniref:hypothetical protein n=1 Tax=Streptomyces sp. Ru87 TaxID=2044307 RepID=UPI000BF8B4CE|nr:hypothetical protein [Streptomyces sp. Ru87]PGH49956.1 hypothetical protein CRI70_14920 [Streptomyces sp. Ru87]
MSDLSIDYALLDRVRGNLDHIAHLMKQPGRDMEQISGQAMGVPELADRMDDFGDEWSYGIKKLTKFSDQASKALLKVKESFDALDKDLAKQMESKEKKAGK